MQCSDDIKVCRIAE